MISSSRSPGTASSSARIARIIRTTSARRRAPSTICEPGRRRPSSARNPASEGVSGSGRHVRASNSRPGRCASASKTFKLDWSLQWRSSATRMSGRSPASTVKAVSHDLRNSPGLALGLRSVARMGDRGPPARRPVGGSGRTARPRPIRDSRLEPRRQPLPPARPAARPGAGYRSPPRRSAAPRRRRRHAPIRAPNEVVRARAPGRPARDRASTISPPRIPNLWRRAA